MFDGKKKPNLLRPLKPAPPASHPPARKTAALRHRKVKLPAVPLSAVGPTLVPQPHPRSATMQLPTLAVPRSKPSPQSHQASAHTKDEEKSMTDLVRATQGSNAKRHQPSAAPKITAPSARAPRRLVSLGKRSADNPANPQRSADKPVKSKRTITLHGCIGSGASARVYAATYKDKRAAIKIANEKGRKALAREATVLKQLDHNNIIKLLGRSRKSSLQSFIILPLLEGGSLQSNINETQRTDDEIIRWLYDISSALAYLHHKKLVHTDVKGDNVLLTGDHMYAILADFGGAKEAGLVQASTDGLTPTFMDPDEAAKSAITEKFTFAPKIDVYAFGLLALACFNLGTCFERTMSLFELASGLRPPLKPSINMPESIRALISSCYTLHSEDPEAVRPSMTEVSSALQPLAARIRA
jgi:tRNA A-37 threonylcarbamoyl transferase component Bud32